MYPVSLLETYKKRQALETWKNDPIKFHDGLLSGRRLWSKQIEVLRTLAEYNYVAVKSGNTVGKSFLSAFAIVWYLLTNCPAKVISTAPTFTQVESIIWREIATLCRISSVPIGAVPLRTELRLRDDWFALGISTDEINRMQGFHSPNLLVVLDEALGIAPEMWEAIIGLHPSKILAIGNPLSAEGNFYNCFTSPLWRTITIGCEECVRWQAQNGQIPGLVTQQWIDERKLEWGEKSPLWQSRILGEFPAESSDILISMKWIDRARNIELINEEEEIKIVASDVATKHGDNQTIVGYRCGHTIEDLEDYSHFPAPMTANKIEHVFLQHTADTIVIDSDGFGEGIADILIDRYLPVTEFHGGYAAHAVDSMRFRNLRSQFYWITAKKFEKGMYSLKKLPQPVFEKLKNQLCSIRTKAPDGTNRIQIETKEDMRARGMPSPDYADCFVYLEYGYFSGRQAELSPIKWR